MFKVYLKQAWQLLKQDKLYTAVYVIGTGLSITTVMVLTMIFYIKTAPVYPEKNRERMALISKLTIDCEMKEGSRTMGGSGVGFLVINDYLYKLKTPVKVGFASDGDNYGNRALKTPREDRFMTVSVMLTDGNYWGILSHRFVDGRAYSQAEYEANDNVAVISQSLAHQLFAGDDAVGQNIELRGTQRRVVGVVEDVSYATPMSFAQVWIPSTPDYNARELDMQMLFGGGVVYCLLDHPSDLKALQSEIGEIRGELQRRLQAYPLHAEDTRIEVNMQAYPYWEQALRTTISENMDWGEILKVMIPILLALLLVPAANLAGMVSSRMDERLGEIGIRKSFGASRSKLMQQVLIENLLLSLVGGVVGLVLSYIVMYTGSNWILTLFDNKTEALPVGGAVTFYTIDMLFNPAIFCTTLLACSLLNYISAAIPAHIALRKNIVDNLYPKVKL